MKANLHQNIRIPSKMKYNFIWFEIINNESKLVMLSMNLHGVGNLLMHPFFKFPFADFISPHNESNGR